MGLGGGIAGVGDFCVFDEVFEVAVVFADVCYEDLGEAVTYLAGGGVEE